MLSYQKAQADKLNVEQLLRKMEQLRGEVKLLEQKEELQAEFQDKDAVAATLTAAILAVAAIPAATDLTPKRKF